MSQDNLLLGTSAAGVGLIGLLSAPAVVSLAAQLRNRESQPEIYEDEDGKSTPEAVKAYSAKIPKFFVLLFSVTGLGLSIALAVLSTLGESYGLFLQNWFSVGTWVRKLPPLKYL